VSGGDPSEPRVVAFLYQLATAPAIPVSSSNQQLLLIRCDGLVAGHLLSFIVATNCRCCCSRQATQGWLWPQKTVSTSTIALLLDCLHLSGRFLDGLCVFPPYTEEAPGRDRFRPRRYPIGEDCVCGGGPVSMIWAIRSTLSACLPISEGTTARGETAGAAGVITRSRTIRWLHRRCALMVQPRNHAGLDWDQERCCVS